MSFGVRRRARKADQFVQIDNTFLRDEALSIEARGLGAYLLTHAEGYRLSSAFLGKVTGMGRDKLRRVLGELEREGYLVREQAREGGRFAEDEFSMSDEKAQVAPVTENPATENQGPETRTHKKTTSENTKIEEHQEDSSSSADDGLFQPPADAPKPKSAEALEAEFEAWWIHYPRKVGKGSALRAFKTARKTASVTELHDGLGAAIRAWDAARTETVFKPHPATWLNRQGWLDDPAAVASATSPNRRTMPGPGVVHTREDIAQQERAFAAMPAATVLSPEEMEAYIAQELGELP